MVSEHAILTDQDRKFVYVVAPDGRAAYRQVTIGAKAGGKRVITSGLTDGDRVITSHLLAVRPNVPVAPKGQTADVRSGNVATAGPGSR